MPVTGLGNFRSFSVSSSCLLQVSAAAIGRVLHEEVVLHGRSVEAGQAGKGT